MTAETRSDQDPLFAYPVESHIPAPNPIRLIGSTTIRVGSRPVPTESELGSMMDAADRRADQGVGNIHDLRSVLGCPSDETPRKPGRHGRPGGVAYQQNSDRDMDPGLSEPVTPMTSDEAALYRSRVDVILENLRQADLGGAVSDSDRVRILAIHRKRSEELEAKRAARDAGKPKY